MIANCNKMSYNRVRTIHETLIINAERGKFMRDCFDNRVEYAIDIIWFNSGSGNGEEALRGLQEAAGEGDGDACYFLARCYSGPRFVDPCFGFARDEAAAREWYNKSIELGSAVGMLGAMRVDGFKPQCGDFVHAPYASKREVWNRVMEMAQSGQLFCRYMIANAYYYGDAVELAGLRLSGQADACALLRKAAQIYEEVLEAGMILCVGNLIDILTSGKQGMPVDIERAKYWEEKAAERGVAFYEMKVAERLTRTQPDKAMELYRRAAEHGDADGYLELGKMYSYCSRNGKNLQTAKEYFEKAIALNPDAIGPYNRLGEIYFKGGEGMEPDYAAAAECFLKVIDRNSWSSDMLGYCYLHGLGVPVDYAKAKKLLEKYPGELLSCAGLGEIYAYGLGVPADISKAMTYWNRYPQDPLIAEHRKQFERTLFGWKKTTKVS